MKKLTAIRGMNDILPESSALWQQVESSSRQLFGRYGYREIRTPIVESTELFARSIGADTDIVAKEMYTFDDRNGDSLTLRPEGTASCVRAGIENGLFYNQKQRLWYVGPMFRHERPQKGRYRQFYQIGAESYGWASADIEAEMIGMSASLLQSFGLVDTELQINSLGDSEARAKFREALINYLSDFESDLDSDSQRRLNSNPLRILDSKNETTQSILLNAPRLSTYLSSDDQKEFESLQMHLDDMSIPYVINSSLVRGLDYYNNTVFEWVNADFGAQATVCAGGRYDNLVEQLGGAATPAFGFAIGLERLIQILQEQAAPICNETLLPQIYLISVGELSRRQAVVIARQLSNSGIAVELHCGEGSMKNQFKRADKSGAQLALIIGEQEAENSQISIKYLAQRQDQKLVSQNDVIQTVTQILESL